jgi:hypothetical protein
METTSAVSPAMAVSGEESLVERETAESSPEKMSITEGSPESIPAQTDEQTEAIDGSADRTLEVAEVINSPVEASESCSSPSSSQLITCQPPLVPTHQTSASSSQLPVANRYKLSKAVKNFLNV